MAYKNDECVGLGLRRLSRIVDEYIRSCIKEFDITENQMSLLLTLYELGPVYQGQLGDQLALERSSISRNVDRLQTKGYIIKGKEYRPQVYLSKQGIDLVKKILPLWKESMEELKLIIGKDGLEMVSVIEQRVYDSFKD